MKYLISAIIYFVLFGVAVGTVHSILGRDFIEGVFPDSIIRWIVRLVFVAYFTFYKTIDFKNLRDSR